MAKASILSKRVQIDKSQATIVSFIAGAVFVSIFSLVSAKALLTQSNYQLRVISKKEKAREVIQKNVKTVNSLVSSYQQFTNTPTNILDGDPLGKGEKDGDNARLILDALPSKYDFPALISSMEKILKDKNFKTSGIAGADGEIAQIRTSEAPIPIEMPFQISVDGSLTSVLDLINTFEKSIRPINIQSVTFKGGNANLSISFDMKTYYQPEKIIKVKTEKVK